MQPYLRHLCFLVLACGAMYCLSIPAAETAVEPPATSSKIEQLKKLGSTNANDAILRLQQLEKSDSVINTNEVRRDLKITLIPLLLKTHQWDLARQEIRDLKLYGESNQDLRAIAYALNDGATESMFEGDTAHAVEEIEKAVSIAAGSGQKELIDTSNHTAAYIYLDTGDFQTALTHELTALDALVGDSQEVQEKRAIYLDGIGQIYAGLKDGKKALEYNDKARALAASTGTPNLADSFAIDRGDAYLLLEDDENARLWFEYALSAARKASNTRREVIALANLSAVARQQRRFVDCSKSSQSSLALAQRAGFNEYVNGLYLILGLCHIGMGQLKAGDAEVERGITGMRQSNSLAELEVALGDLAETYSRAGQYQNSTKALVEQRGLAEKLFKADQERAIAQMNVKFETKEREKEIRILEERNSIQNEELKNRNLQRTVAILSAILVFVVAGIIVREKEKLRRRAHKSNQDKSKYIADAVHDLRQPMQAIGNLLEASRHAFSRGDMKKSQELVDLAKLATQSMRTSFNSVLELAKLDSGAILAEYSNFSIVELVNEVFHSLRPLADQRGISMRIFISAHTTRLVQSDRNLLGRVISNLISNAIKYSDVQKGIASTVLIGLVFLHDRFRIDVIDNGIGIPGSEHKNIFKPFHQIGNPEKDNERGLGLGLSIVETIIDLLEEHHLRMRSTVGIGTRFSIDIPASLEYFKEDGIDDYDVPDFEVEGLYVLYVEDDKSVRESTEALFREFGILCEASNSLDELTRKLPSIERMPDLILSDYHLTANATAIDVARAIQTEFNSKIPTIVLTGGHVEIEFPKDLGRTITLRKPVSARTLLAEIHVLAKELVNETANSS